MTSSQHTGRRASLGLGTVQFGLSYGISNGGGQTRPDEVGRVLEVARHAGIDVLDTAAAYGDAERVLGAEPGAQQFRVVTKFPRLPEQISPADAVAFAARSFDESLRVLRRSSVYGLLAHHADDLLGASGPALIEWMSEVVAAGKVSRVGASVYEGAQLEQLARHKSLTLVQVPVNVFDQRLIRSGLLREARGQGIEVHARSSFLQGLIFLEPSALDAHFDPARGTLGRFRDTCRALGVTVAEAALSFVRDAPVDVALVGVNTAGQLSELARAAETRVPLDALAGFALEDPKILNPALWPRR
jgi:aryl-alcohol dehydrogenase-like predicted oxidoreductase